MRKNLSQGDLDVHSRHGELLVDSRRLAQYLFIAFLADELFDPRFSLAHQDPSRAEQ